MKKKSLVYKQSDVNALRHEMYRSASGVEYIRMSERGNFLSIKNILKKQGF